MNYIYDILLNFQEEFYEFYEWNIEDEITHIRRIPLFKITKNDFKTIKNGTIKFDKYFCQHIQGRTERFRKTGVSQINYAFLISDGKEVIALKLDKSLITTSKSSLLLDEGDEVCEMTLDLNTEKIKYKVLKENKEIPFQTRQEIQNTKFINKNLLELYKKNDYNKLNYLYFECFRKNQSDIKTIYNKLKKETKTNEETYSKIFNFFKLINQQEK